MRPLKMTILAIATLFGVSVMAAENPKAASHQTVEVGNARFTVLTSQLIRMEWSEDKSFEDRASLTFINREMPQVPFRVSRSGQGVKITTPDLTLTYTGKGKFSPQNLSATFMLEGKKVTWHYGDEDTENLLGTTRTLDGTRGWSYIRHPIEKGILSRAGWAVVDDSANQLFVPVSTHWKNWVEARKENGNLDLYLFAYGHEYKKALGDYMKVAGSVPLPPRYVFGYWWSRYWQYSDNEFRDLVSQIKSLDIPIDVLIVDMDWHETFTLKRKESPQDEFGQRIGWTGYTWKDQLFPSPKNFWAWCHDQKLKTSLNLHPASGIQPYEQVYDSFTKAYEWKEPGKPVPFHIDEQKWADCYFSEVLGPKETEGVDFWWLDWQQWMESKYTKGLSNTFWLNHTFAHHMAEKDPQERPLIYHRWGGLGSHRYQVGFSGDAVIGWDLMDFIPWFTSTASNVGYGYWGHDIGGHMFAHGAEKVTDPELYLRFLQMAVFTPIYKTHCTKDKTIERRIWQFPNHMFYMRDAIQLRYRLAPYIYNAARQTSKTGVSMCRPMYYNYPEHDKAYSMKRQFMFGDDIIATSVFKPVDKVSGLSELDVWFPEGEWFDMATGNLYKGDSVQMLSYTQAENPFYARAGAIIPMNPHKVKNLQDESDELIFTFIPGADGKTVLEEDDGHTKQYMSQYTTTRVEKTTSQNRITVVISAREGNYQGKAEKRNYELRLPCTFMPQSVTVNGVRIPYHRIQKDADWTYDGFTLAPVIRTGMLSTDAPTVVEISFNDGDLEKSSKLYGLQGVFSRCVALTPEFKEVYATCVDPYPLLPASYLDFSQLPCYITERPKELDKWIEQYERTRKEFIPSIEKMGEIDPQFISRMRMQCVGK